MHMFLLSLKKLANLDDYLIFYNFCIVFKLIWTPFHTVQCQHILNAQINSFQTMYETLGERDIYENNTKIGDCQYCILLGFFSTCYRQKHVKI